MRLIRQPGSGASARPRGAAGEGPDFAIALARKIAEPSGMGAGIVRIAVLAAYFGAINVVAFRVFAWDKIEAAAGRNRRTPERTLLALTAAGGTLGALAARWLFKHKTRKQPFVTFFWLIAAAQAVLIAVLARSARG